jgi:hypothetical protein
MIKIESRNRKKEFSRSALLSCLAEDLAFENQKLIELVKAFNYVMEFEMGIDIESAFPELWNQVGQTAVEIAERKEARIYELY